MFWGLEASLAYRRHFPAINWLNSYSLYKDRLESWFKQNVSPDFPAVMSEALRILQLESELDEIVKLVGVDALSPKERLMLETARSVREDFLQQNAFDEFDSYTSLDKQYALMKLILSFNKKAAEAIEKGADVNDVFETDAAERIGRAKSAPQDKYEEIYAQIEKDADIELYKLVSEGGASK